MCWRDQCCFQGLRNEILTLAGAPIKEDAGTLGAWPEHH